MRFNYKKRKKLFKMLISKIYFEIEDIFSPRVANPKLINSNLESSTNHTRNVYPVYPFPHPLQH